MKFHVGQRVRIVECLTYPHVVGLNATVSSRDDWESAEAYRIVIDDGITTGYSEGDWFFANKLEPIPDATELGTWDQVQAICKWTPSTVKA